MRPSTYTTRSRSGAGGRSAGASCWSSSPSACPSRRSTACWRSPGATRCPCSSRPEGSWRGGSSASAGPPPPLLGGLGDAESLLQLVHEPLRDLVALALLRHDHLEGALRA